MRIPSQCAVRRWGGISVALGLLATMLTAAPAGVHAQTADATIVVRKAGDRTGIALNDDTTPLAGATFAAYRKGSSQTQSIPAGPPAATCTTDANGVCTLTVDPSSERYLVVEQSAPAGWAVIDQIALGRFNASGTNKPYRWNVAVTPGETTQIPETSIIVNNTQSWPARPNPAGELTVADYRWANVRDNPLLDETQCGLNIALIFDQSGSIGSNQSLVQNAAVEFVEDLTGTPTEIATFTFATNSPRDNGNSRNRPDLIPIADAVGADEVIANINGLSDPGGGTNWDYALRQVANAAPFYDLAIMLTDGNPTAWRGDTSSTADVDDYDVEEAVHSANWVKSLGTRVVSIGFSGQAGGLTATNLALISGPQQGNPANPQASDDFFLTTFGELADLLSRIALNACGGTVNVSKKISPTWTDIDDVDLEPDWPFERDANQTYVEPPSGQTAPDGNPLQFTVSFEQGALSRDVTVFEPTLGPNLPIPDPDGKNARCTITGSSDPQSRVVNVGTNGVTVEDVTDKEIVSCLFVNSPLQLLAEKYLDVEGDGTRDPSDPPLEGWTIFIDENGNSMPDPGEPSGITDANGQVLFDRLPAEGEYRVCEVLQGGFFNTDPGGGSLCKDQLVEFPSQPVDPIPPAGPVEFGNVGAGSFTISKSVGDGSGFVPLDTRFTIRVECERDGQPVSGFPRDYVLENGDTVRVGPLFDGTICTIEETDAQGAEVTISQPTVSIPDDDGVDVLVDNEYPAGTAAIVKIVDGPLAELIPEGTDFGVEVTCSYPSDFPVQGLIPGFDPLELTVESGDNGQPGTPVEIGLLPAGSTCDIEETDDNGATTVDIDPSNITIVGSPTPITVTITNTFEPAALKIVKEVAGAPVPADTEFQADVQCTFRGTTTFDERVMFGIGPDDAYIVDDQPVGAECTVTEIPPPGDPDVVYDPGQTVTLEPPPDPVLIVMTITNTFEPGSLTVTKVVEDGGFVPGDAEFIVNVDCTYAGNTVPGYPQDVVLTKDNPVAVFSDLPAGAECTVTEVDSNGASDVVIEPDQPVTITPDAQGPPVAVTVTNEFPLGAFDITKSVVDQTGLVPGTTEFTVDLTCTYPTGYPATGEIPGFDPKSVPIEDGQTISSGALPIGSTCDITESNSAGAGSVVITPETIVVGDANGPTGVIVENTYPAGAIELRKAVDDGGSQAIPPGTPYRLRVECSFPGNFPGSPGDPIPGYSPLEVTVLSGSLGDPGPPVRVGQGGLLPPPPNDGNVLPVGSSCTVSEPEPQGAADVVIEPPQPVIVTDELQNPVEVVVTNVYPLGNGEVVKVTKGDLAGQLAPPGTPFTVEITCRYPTSFPPAVAGQPIPGYTEANPTVVVIEAGPPDVAGTPAPFGPLPIGSTCEFVETETNGASDVTIEPEVFTIDSATTPARATVTNAYDDAGLLITKTVDGPGGALVPPSLEYTVRVRCRVDPNMPDYYFDEPVQISVGPSAQAPGPAEISGLLAGSWCEVTELQSYGAAVTIDPAGEFQLTSETTPVVVDVSVTNTFPEGALEIVKDVTGELADLVPDGTEYRIGVDCSLAGIRLVGFPSEVILTTPGDLTETITGLPVGAECLATESDTNGAVSPPSFEPPGEEEFQSGIVTITADVQDPVSITVINEYPGARGQIVKVVDGPQAGLISPGTRFDVEVTCSYPANHPAAPGIVPGFDGLEVSILSGDTAGDPGPPTEFGPVPPGSACELVETENQGASDVTIEPNPVIVDTVDEPYAEVSVTNTFSEGGLTLTKVVDGDGASLVPPGTIYTVQVTCTLGGDPVLDETIELVAGTPETIDDLPIGTECAIVETDAQGADEVTIEPPSPVTINPGAATVEVTITNTYRLGDFEIVKVVDGDLASLIAPGTEFGVRVECAFPVPFPVEGPIPGFDPLDTTIVSGQPGQAGPGRVIGPLPVGSTCTINETDNNGATAVTVVPDTITVPDVSDDPVTVTVTNTFDSAAVRIIKVLDGPGAPSLPLDTEFRARVVCTPPAGSPSDGFDGEVSFGVDDPAIVAGQPIGSSCTVTETETNGAVDVSYSPGRTVVLDGQQPVVVDVTITNTIGVGGLTVDKALAGPGASFVPATTVFLADVDCSLGGTRLAGFPRELQLAAPNGTDEVSGIPIGSSCTVTETERHGAQRVTISPPQPVTIGDNTAVEITLTNTFGVGDLVVDKVLSGPGATSATGPFRFVLDCVFLGAPIDPQPLVPQIDLPSTSTTVEGVPIGATCAVQELAPFGGAIGPPTIVPSRVTVVDGTGAAFTVTNTFAPPPPLPDTGGDGPRQLLPIGIAVLWFGIALWRTGSRRTRRLA